MGWIMIKLAICDDEKNFRSEIFNVITKYFNENNIERTCDIFENGDDFIKNCEIEGYNYDFVILDILMEGINGIEVARKIKEKNPFVEIIFLTSSREYIFDGFDVNAFNYILKSTSEEKILLEVKKIIDKLGLLADSKKFLLLNKSSMKIIVSPSDVMYLESNKRIVTVHCKEENVEVYGKLETLLDEVNRVSKVNFIKVHRSYVVNPYYIKKFDSLNIHLKNNETIPISKSNLENLKKLMLDYLEVTKY